MFERGGGKKMKKKVNDVKDMFVSIEFDPIEIGFIQERINAYLKVANSPSMEQIGKACIGKIEKSLEELEKNYEWGEIDD